MKKVKAILFDFDSAIGKTMEEFIKFIIENKIIAMNSVDIYFDKLYFVSI